MVKNQAKSTQEKTLLASQLVLAALSVPLHGKICNFQRLSTSYVPKDIQCEVENSDQVQAQVFAVSMMLQIQGVPSRASLFNSLTLRNSHIVPGCPQVGALFKLVQEEESPFNIQRQG